MWRGLASGVCAAVVLCGSQAAAEKLDIVQIFEQFAMTNAAASKCLKPEQETLSNYLFNYEMVMRHAFARLKERSPSKNPEDIRRAMTSRISAIEEQVKTKLTQEGCQSPEIQKMLSLFDFHARWDIFEGTVK